MAKSGIADTSSQDVQIEPTSRRRQWLIGASVAVVALGAVAVFAVPSLLRWSEAEMSVSGIGCARRWRAGAIWSATCRCRDGWWPQ